MYSGFKLVQIEDRDIGQANLRKDLVNPDSTYSDIKELSLCHKRLFSSPYIFAI